MSRVGLVPIKIPDGVKVKVDNSCVNVSGPKGELEKKVLSGTQITVSRNSVFVKRDGDSKRQKSIHGLFRTLIFNMITGVSQGYEKTVEMRGVGFRAQVQDRNLVLNMGFSHQVNLSIPDGVEIKTVKKPVVEQLSVNQIVISGIDKEKVGEFAAVIRQLYPVEPYKGKGVRIMGEYVRRKAGKKAAAA